MSKIATRIGIWAAWAQTVAGYGYLLVYILFMVQFPLKPWSGIEAFAADINTPYMTWIAVIQFLAFSQSILMFVLTTALHEFTSPEKKVLSRLGMGFALAFSIYSSAHYYVQWLSVRQSILHQELEGLGWFVQFNFNSPISAINMLGWMFFYGLTTLTLSPIFEKKGIQGWIRWPLLVNGVGCILCVALLVSGATWPYLVWMGLISLTWFVYPLIGVLLNRNLSHTL